MAGESSRSRPVSAARLPHHVLARLFEYLNIKDLAACRRVCRHWMAYLEYEDCEVWEALCRREVPDSALSDPYLLCEVPTFLAKLRAFKHAWNSRDASRNVYVRSNGFTVHRNPIAQSTDGIRGKMGVSTGLHAWELAWEGPLGTVAVVGLATRHAALQCPGYVPLLGSDDQSWGWNLVDNALLHNGDTRQPFPQINNPPKYQVGERIRMIVDCDEHVLYFEKGCEFLGVAFRELPPVKLFPAVCAVYGNTEVSMIYLGPPLLG